ncbi:UDP-glucose 4-epimerase GalE [Helicobacter labetoulli]|uniref:UDP-glucose 4-epimerase GalE n=1 Tax=Helicobacter labetoulli TaxID=2315333 RepID=UPI000EF74871|nr:UDP-glucose 4-epimerase GalE [Helicobacter labetoulli]
MLNKKILITGGAGYIGSHANALLNTLGFQTIVLDNLVYGHKESLHYAPLPFSHKNVFTKNPTASSQNLETNNFAPTHTAHTQMAENPHSKLTCHTEHSEVSKKLDSRLFANAQNDKEVIQKRQDDKILNTTSSKTQTHSTDSNILNTQDSALDFLAQLVRNFNGGGVNTQDSILYNNLKSNLNSNNDLSRQLHTAHKNTTFIHSSLSDKATLDSIFSTYQIQAVMHFAAFAYVGESVKDPSKYYYNNVANSLSLLESMRKANVKNIIFSSTCATYGHPLHLPITESHPQNPINPYGYSKLVVENMLKDFSHAYGLNYVILRYFNAAGASMLFNIGESHSPETHLIPLLLQTALGQRETLSIYGDDYPTKDGSCIRDYIHIDDLANAHILALKYLLNGGKSEAFNLGNGEGFSIFELLECASRLCERKIPYTIESRRDGDPATLIGDSTKAKEILGWKPHFADIETILSSALNWHSNQRY